MKTHKYVLLPTTLGLIHDVISQAEKDGTVMVAIGPVKAKRSIAQNALYWGAWLPSLSEQTGYTEEELHDKFKARYMLRVYLGGAETKQQEEWMALYDVIKEDGTQLMIDNTLKTISTTWATVKQFTRYLEMIENMCRSNDMKLPVDPNYRMALHG